MLCQVVVRGLDLGVVVTGDLIIFYPFLSCISGDVPGRPVELIERDYLIRFGMIFRFKTEGGGSRQSSPSQRQDS